MAYAEGFNLDELEHPKLLIDVLTAPYRKIIIGLPSSGFTLVPKTLFSEEHASDFARFLDVKETEKVFAQTLDNENVIVFKTDENLVSAVKRYDLQNVVHTADGWIKAVARSKLRFYNSFEFKNPDELVYFTTFVTGELNLLAAATTLVISGDISYGDQNLTRLTDFYPRIEINGIKNLPVRPTTDLAKEALFNILQNQIDFEDIHVLDLFSGTGNISMEFASRGAAKVVSVDRSIHCVNYLKDATRQHGLNQVKVFKDDIFKYLQHETDQFDLIFADPPYDLNRIPELPGLIFDQNIVKPGGLLIVEHQSMQNLAAEKLT
eukprot:gene15783-15940_t